MEAKLKPIVAAIRQRLVASTQDLGTIINLMSQWVHQGSPEAYNKVGHALEAEIKALGIKAISTHARVYCGVEMDARSLIASIARGKIQVSQCSYSSWTPSTAATAMYLNEYSLGAVVAWQVPPGHALADMLALSNMVARNQAHNDSSPRDISTLEDVHDALVAHNEVIVKNPPTVLPIVGIVATSQALVRRLENLNIRYQASDDSVFVALSDLPKGDAKLNSLFGIKI